MFGRCLLARSALTRLSRQSSSIALPGVPRRLADVAKMELFEAEEPSRIGTIWESFHEDKPELAACCVPAEEHMKIVERARESPMFIFPVRREQGHFLLLSQFDVAHEMFVMTFLEDYKRNPAAAQPWLSVTLFSELLTSKAVGLLRADFAPERLVKREGEHVMSLVRRYYGSDNYDRVWTFNHAERHFNLDAYLSSCPDGQ
jgi:ATP synthase F1 complex assembly factor 1